MPGDFNYGILDETGHRAWPVPRGPWLMTQTWHDLLFAHWQVDPRELALHIPRDLPLDLFEGEAWLAVVPFRMTNVALRGMPTLPGVSAFPELNVRTYVIVGGRPGIYFFSLDAGSRTAAWAARLALRLPYFTARMAVASSSAGIDYRSRRRGRRAAELVAHYAPTGPPVAPRPGSREHFLTERYCLYAHGHRRRLYRLEIHHPPWPLQPAAAEFTRNSMASAAGLSPRGDRPLLHFAKRQDMVAWAPVEP